MTTNAEMAMLSKAVLPALAHPPTGSWVRDKPARLTIRVILLMFLIAFVKVKWNKKNTETAMLSVCCHPLPIPPTGCWVRLTQPSRALRRIAAQSRGHGSIMRARIHIQSRGHLSTLHGSTYNHYSPDLNQIIWWKLLLNLHFTLWMIPHQRSRGRQLMQCT